MFFRRNRKIEAVRDTELDEKHPNERIREKSRAAAKLESYGHLKDAERLYRKNITSGINPRFAYERLYFIKVRKGEREGQIRILNEAVQFFENAAPDEVEALNYFKKLLKKAQSDT